MKHKIIGAVSMVVILLVSIFAPYFATEKKVRYIQHIDAPKKEECNCGEKLCTHLPLIEINTDNVKIPGEYADKNNPDNTGKYTLAEDGEKTIKAKIGVVDHESTNNHLTDEPTLSSDIRIRIRGRSSRLFDKKGYLVKFIDENDKSKKVSFVGMQEHNEWALHGPFLDKTLIRNYLAYNLAGQMMDWAPNVRFCEVVLNGEYQGLYLATETVNAGEEGARLKMSVDKKHNNYTGYILRVDAGSENQNKNLDTFTQYARKTVSKKDIVYPKASALTPEMKKKINDDFSLFEKSLYSYDFNNEDYGYKDFIDVNSFADYFIINEVFCNYDVGSLSTYIYKDVDNKFKMAVWDFNNGADNYQEQHLSWETFDMPHDIWYNMLCKDEDFTRLINERYEKYRKTILSDEYINNFIDETIAYLGDAVDRNFEKWGYTFQEELLSPSDRNLHSYDEAVTQLKNFFKYRLSWLDNNIETIKEYSAYSKIKKYDEVAK